MTDTCSITWWRIFQDKLPAWECSIHDYFVVDGTVIYPVVDKFPNPDGLISALIMLSAVGLFGITMVEFMLNKIDLVINPIFDRIENRYYKVKYRESAYIRY